MQGGHAKPRMHNVLPSSRGVHCQALTGTCIYLPDTQFRRAAFPPRTAVLGRTRVLPALSYLECLHVEAVNHLEPYARVALAGGGDGHLALQWAAGTNVWTVVL